MEHFTQVEEVEEEPVGELVEGLVNQVVAVVKVHKGIMIIHKQDTKRMCTIGGHPLSHPVGPGRRHIT
jgi:hypothetical protein